MWKVPDTLNFVFGWSKSKVRVEEYTKLAQSTCRTDLKLPMVVLLFD